MTQIKHQTKEVRHTITEGDIFFVEENSIYFKLLGYESESKFALYDLADDTIVAKELNHVTHAINHVRKHYGDFIIIPNDRVTIDIK